MNRIKQRIHKLKQQIQEAEQTAGRAKGSVQLLAVSKTKPVTDLITAYQCGQRHFAESYLQEAIIKQQALSAFNITWHFIGPIQSNKTRAIATQFSWVHSVDRLKIARRLNEQRPDNLPALNVCLQVNISGEGSKSGIELDQLPDLLEPIMMLPKIRLRGVMAIPQPEQDYEKQRLPYRRLYNFVKQLDNPQLDVFSFGMSNDVKAAITEGSTQVRIGTAIFGTRTTK